MSSLPVRAGIVAPLLVDHVNTDVIIRSCDISCPTTEGLGRYLFACWRGQTAGEEFVLDRAEYRAAKLLLTGTNFGCGSSREAAVWALRDFGIEGIIAKSFGSIFFSNCIRNQIVPAVLTGDEIDAIDRFVRSERSVVELVIDVQRMAVDLPDGRSFFFDLNPIQQMMLSVRCSEIDLILEQSDAISAFQHTDQHRRPWVYLG